MLVVEPPPAVQDGKTVFWPAKERLRIGRRATQIQQDIRAFEQALADQGHGSPVMCLDVHGYRKLPRLP